MKRYVELGSDYIPLEPYLLPETVHARQIKVGLHTLIASNIFRRAVFLLVTSLPYCCYSCINRAQRSQTEKA